MCTMTDGSRIPLHPNGICSCNSLVASPKQHHFENSTSFNYYGGIQPQTSKEGKTAPVLKPAEAKTLVGHCECLLRNVPYKIHPHWLDPLIHDVRSAVYLNNTLLISTLLLRLAEPLRQLIWKVKILICLAASTIQQMEPNEPSNSRFSTILWFVRHIIEGFSSTKRSLSRPS